MAWAAAGALALGASGCTSQPVNPSFDVTVRDASAELQARKSHKVHLQRPVVVLAGYLDPGFGVARAAEMIRSVVDQRTWVIEVPFFSVTSFDASRARVIAKLIDLFGADAEGDTIEVDVIGISMGGLVARHAAVERDGAPRLRIARLFTISTPHRGALAAEMLQPDNRAAQMRAGSTLLTDLDCAYPTCGYEFISYVRLGDGIVGEEAARGPDGRLWWVADKPLSPSHMHAAYDQRIIADIVRRLAGEEPWTTDPCAPLPGAEESSVAHE